MKLTSKGRYAVMALADIAAFDKKNPVSLRDISLRQNISLLYLEQIFLRLKRNNIVKSTRGTNGGYIIANNHSSHANAWNADTGNTIVANASRARNSFGYVRSAGRSGTAYAIYRSFLQFDTSGITGTVWFATLKIYGYINGTADLKIVKSTAFGSGYEGSSLSTAAAVGSVVTPYYDSLLVKVTSWAKNLEDLKLIKTSHPIR